MSQNFETCNSTLSNMRAYGQKCYNSFDYFIYFSLSFQHISLSVCNTALSPLWSPSLRCSLFLSHFHFFFISLSLHFGIIAADSTRLYASFSLSLSLSFIFYFFFCHYLSLFLFLSRRRRWFRSEAELVDWSLPIWTSTHQSEALLTQGSRRSLLVVLHSSRHRWLVEFGHWLICWVGVFLKILSFFIIIYFVEVFGFGIFWRIQWLWL